MAKLGLREVILISIFPAAGLAVSALDSSLEKAVPLYLLFWAILFLFNIGIYSLNRIHSLGKFYKLFKIIIAFTVLLPILVLSLYPFTILSFLILGSVIILGYITPFISLKASWWLYTLGGIFPLPKKVGWIKEGINTGEVRDASSQELKNWTVKFSIALLFFSLLIYEKHPNLIIFILQTVALIGIFAIALAFGVKARRS